MKKHFNRMTIDGKHILALETNLSNAEGQISTVIRKIRKTRMISNDDLPLTITLMSLFACRTPTRRDHLDSIKVGLQNHLFRVMAHNEEFWDRRDDGLTQNIFLDSLRKGDIEPEPSTKEGLIQDELNMVRNLIPLLSKRHWTLLDSANSGQNFMISDNPVCLFYRDPSKGTTGGFWDGVGFATAGTVIHFPISSTLSLFGTLEREQAPIVNARLINSLNGHVIGCADRFIYFNDDGFTATTSEGISHGPEDVLAYFIENKKSEKQ